MTRRSVGASIGAAAIASSLGMAMWAGAPAGASDVGKSSAPVSRTALEQALARRQATLSHLTSVVKASTMLSTAVRRTLATELATETSGIDSLVSSVPGEPTATLAATASTMVAQYRVYLVMVPKVRIALTAARQQRAEQRATGHEPAVAARIQAAQSAGRTVAQPQAADDDLVHQVTQAMSDTAAAGQVLAVQPSGYPGNAGTLRAARSDLQAARAAGRAAASDLRTIRTSLGAS